MQEHANSAEGDTFTSYCGSSRAEVVDRGSCKGKAEQERERSSLKLAVLWKQHNRKERHTLQPKHTHAFKSLCKWL